MKWTYSREKLDAGFLPCNVRDVNNQTAPLQSAFRA